MKIKQLMCRHWNWEKLPSTAPVDLYRCINCGKIKNEFNLKLTDNVINKDKGDKDNGR